MVRGVVPLSLARPAEVTRPPKTAGVRGGRVDRHPCLFATPLMTEFASVPINWTSLFEMITRANVSGCPGTNWQVAVPIPFGSTEYMHEKVWWITIAPVEYPMLSVRTPFRMLPFPSAENEPTAAARVPSTNAPPKENPYAPWMLPTPYDEPLDPEAARTTSPNASTGTDGHVLIDYAPLVRSFVALRRGPHRPRVCHVPLGPAEAGERDTPFG